jgi:hypothetical protein
MNVVGNSDCFPCKSAIKKPSLRLDQCSHENRSSRSTQTFSDTTATQDSLDIQRVTFTVVEVRTYEQFPPQGEWEHSDVGPVCIDDFETDRIKSKKQVNQVVEKKETERIKLSKSSPFSSLLRTEKEIERAKILKEANKGWKREQRKKKNSLLGRWFCS